MKNYIDRNRKSIAWFGIFGGFVVILALGIFFNIGRDARFWFDGAITLAVMLFICIYEFLAQRRKKLTSGTEVPKTPS